MGGWVLYSTLPMLRCNDDRHSGPLLSSTCTQVHRDTRWTRYRILCTLGISSYSCLLSALIKPHFFTTHNLNDTQMTRAEPYRWPTPGPSEGDGPGARIFVCIMHVVANRPLRSSAPLDLPPRSPVILRGACDPMFQALSLLVNPGACRTLFPCWQSTRIIIFWAENLTSS